MGALAKPRLAWFLLAMPRTHPRFWLLAVFLAAQASPAFALDDYDQCLKLLSSDADKALDAAESWADEGGGVPAAHCKFLALKQLGHYTEAAEGLEALAVARGAGDAHNRADILSQAGNAWILQHEAQRAYNAFSAGLQLVPGDRDMLIDRARAAALGEDFKAAADDLDQVIAKAPDHVDIDALILRANARRLSGDLNGAKADAETAIAKAPTVADGWIERGIARFFQGDKPGARGDWRMALKLSPDSKAGLDAQALLERDARGEPMGAQTAAP